GIEAAVLERLAELTRIDRRRRGDEDAPLLGPSVGAVGERQLENPTLVLGRERVPELPPGGGPGGLVLDVVGDKPSDFVRGHLDLAGLLEGPAGDRVPCLADCGGRVFLIHRSILSRRALGLPDSFAMPCRERFRSPDRLARCAAILMEPGRDGTYRAHL